MKNWVIMYALIWASFFQIIIILFPALGTNVAVYLHTGFGVVVLFLAGYSFRRVSKTACPPRIKRITKATAILGGVQGILGAILLGMIYFGASPTLQEFVVFLHAVNALAIITQASSSATSYDMWEGKEYVTSEA